MDVVISRGQLKAGPEDYGWERLVCSSSSHCNHFPEGLIVTLVERSTIFLQDREPGLASPE